MEEKSKLPFTLMLSDHGVENGRALGKILGTNGVGRESSMEARHGVWAWFWSVTLTSAVTHQSEN